MKKLILKYLNTRYSNACMKKSKFGCYPSFKGELLATHKLVDELIDVLGEGDRKFIKSVIEDWHMGLPVVDYLPNTTNPNVLVFE